MKREISFERIALIAGSLGRLATTSAFAQSTQTFNLSATMDVCNSCDIGTQNLLAAEDDRHDSADAALDCDVRSENVRHDQTDKEIEHNDNNSEDKQDQLADEEEEQQQSALESDQARARDRGGGASTADRPDHEPGGHR